MQSSSTTSPDPAPSERRRRPIDYGDFTEEEVRELLVEYCEHIKSGACGWGISFRDWVWLNDIARPGKFLQLFRIQQP